VVTPPLRRDRAGVAGTLLPEASEQLHTDRPQPHPAGRRRSGDNRYSRAARFYKQWRDEGVLSAEADPAIYVYHQEFTYAGTIYVRRGFMGRQRLTRFGEGQVFRTKKPCPPPRSIG